MFVDILVICAVVAVIAAAALYIYKAKKRGAKCVGCPYSQNCGGCCSGMKNI